MLMHIYREVVKRNKKKLEMNIVIIGSRGVPCKYGDFETFAERLAIELDLRIDEKN